MPSKQAPGRKKRTLEDRLKELQGKVEKNKKRAELKNQIQSARDQLKKL